MRSGISADREDTVKPYDPALCTAPEIPLFSSAKKEDVDSIQKFLDGTVPVVINELKKK